MANPAGLKPAKRRHARHMAVEAAQLALRHRGLVHYTQDAALRWQGISDHLKAWRGEFPRFADCSSFVTWCLWNGLDHYHKRDIVNAEKWRGGYTGTLLKHGVRIPRLYAYGDVVIYGRPGSTGAHTALYVGGGMVISHGSEAGPFLLPFNYRRDIQAYRRFI